MNVTSECDSLADPNKVSQDSQSLSEDDLFKKKVSYEELKKMLYDSLKSKAELNDACRRLQIRYNELLGSSQ